MDIPIGKPESPEVAQWKDELCAIVDRAPSHDHLVFMMETPKGAQLSVLLPDPRPRPTPAEVIAQKLQWVTLTAEEAEKLAERVRSRVGAVLAEDDGLCQASNPRTGKRCLRRTVGRSPYCSLHIRPGSL